MVFFWNMVDLVRVTVLLLRHPWVWKGGVFHTWALCAMCSTHPGERDVGNHKCPDAAHTPERRRYPVLESRRKKQGWWCLNFLSSRVKPFGSGGWSPVCRQC